MTLLADDNCPGSQLVSNWEPAHSLVEDALSGAEIAPCLPALSVVCLPFCLWWGQGPVHSQLAILWYSLNSFSVSRPDCALQLFAGKLSLSLSLFPSLVIPEFGLLSHISSLRLSSGHSGLVLILSIQPALPCSVLCGCWRTGVSGLLLCWELRLGV